MQLLAALDPDLNSVRDNSTLPQGNSESTGITLLVRNTFYVFQELHLAQHVDGNRLGGVLATEREATKEIGQMEHRITP